MGKGRQIEEKMICFCQSIPLTPMKYHRLSLCAAALAAATGLLISTPSVQAASLWNEATDGDLSDDGNTPTPLGALLPGSNVLKANFNAGATSPSPDYFTIEIPQGFALEKIELLSWKASPTFEDVAFMAIQKGDTFNFTIPADRSNANGLLGWTHLRSTQVNTNKVLLEMAVSDQSPAQSGVADFYKEEGGLYSPELLAQFPELPDRLLALEDQWVPGAEGFDLPLKAGTYSFWLRQGSDININAAFDFHTVAVATPEPISLLALGLAAGTSLLVCKKQRDPMV
jgi:hypothetical protein